MVSLEQDDGHAIRSSRDATHSVRPEHPAWLPLDDDGGRPGKAIDASLTTSGRFLTRL